MTVAVGLSTDQSEDETDREPLNALRLLVFLSLPFQDPADSSVLPREDDGRFQYLEGRKRGQKKRYQVDVERRGRERANPTVGSPSATHSELDAVATYYK